MKYLDYFEKLKYCIDNIDWEVLKLIQENILRVINDDGNIYIIGNGGSASTASHWVVDMSKGLENENLKRVNIYNLSDNMPLITAYANDVAYEDIYYLQLKNKIKSTDILLILSCSGNSKNLVKAIEYAHKNDAFCISIVGDFNGKVLEYSDLKLIIKSRNYGIIEDIELSLNHQIVQNIRKDKE